MSRCTLRVGVIDTGLDPSLPILARLPHVKWQVAPPAGDRSDPLKHGTSVTQLILEQIEDRVQQNICLLVAAPLTERGGDAADVVNALRWMQAERAGIVVMAFASTVRHESVERVLAELARCGTTLVAAAGNPHTGQVGLSFPAQCADVVSVGVSDYASSYETWPKAPDVLIELDVYCPGGAATIGGTSAATAIYAGQLLQQLG